VAYHRPAVGLPGFPTFVYWKFVRLPLCPSPPSSVDFQHSCPLCCVLVLSFFFFWRVGGVSLPRGLRWFIPELSGGIPQEAWCSPDGLPNISQAGLVAAGAHLFSHCSMA
jgi:hypothetical protein